MSSKCLHIGVALLITAVSLFPQDPKPSDAEAGSLDWHSRKAIARGEKSIHLSAPDVLFANVEDLDSAMRHTTAVIAQPIASATSHDAYHIFTWTKYRVVERLSSQSIVLQDELPPDVPKSLLPLKQDEFLIPEIGGTINLNGVLIKADGLEGTPAPEGARHLMFLMFRARGALAQSNYGAFGLFWIDKSDKIHARNEADNALKNDLFNRTDRQTSILRDLAKTSTELQRVSRK